MLTPMKLLRNAAIFELMRGTPFAAAAEEFRALS